MPCRDGCFTATVADENNGFTSASLENDSNIDEVPIVVVVVNLGYQLYTHLNYLNEAGRVLDYLAFYMGYW